MTSISAGHFSSGGKITCDGRNFNQNVQNYVCSVITLPLTVSNMEMCIELFYICFAFHNFFLKTLYSVSLWLYFHFHCNILGTCLDYNPFPLDCRQRLSLCEYWITENHCIDINLWAFENIILFHYYCSKIVLEIQS